MSLFQCDECGCVENTALGWYWCRDNKRLTKPEYLGKALCCVCAPTEFPSGEPIEGMGVWHNCFERYFLPKGQYETCPKGNLRHKETKLPPTLECRTTQEQAQE